MQNSVCGLTKRLPDTGSLGTVSMHKAKKKRKKWARTQGRRKQQWMAHEKREETYLSRQCCTDWHGKGKIRLFQNWDRCCCHKSSSKLVPQKCKNSAPSDFGSNENFQGMPDNLHRLTSHWSTHRKCRSPAHQIRKCKMIQTS